MQGLNTLKPSSRRTVSLMRLEIRGKSGGPRPTPSSSGPVGRVKRSASSMLVSMSVPMCAASAAAAFSALALQGMSHQVSHTCALWVHISSQHDGKHGPEHFVFMMHKTSKETSSKESRGACHALSQCHVSTDRCSFTVSFFSMSKTAVVFHSKIKEPTNK